ncbi:hypothetical protein ALC56_12667, partial [Trachymyrmex septentrionalis]
YLRDISEMSYGALNAQGGFPENLFEIGKKIDGFEEFYKDSIINNVYNEIIYLHSKCAIIHLQRVYMSKSEIRTSDNYSVLNDTPNCTKRCKVEGSCGNYAMFLFFFKCVFIILLFTKIYVLKEQRTQRDANERYNKKNALPLARSDKVLAEGSSRETRIAVKAVCLIQNRQMKMTFTYSYVCCYNEEALNFYRIARLSWLVALSSPLGGGVAVSPPLPPLSLPPAPTELRHLSVDNFDDEVFPDSGDDGECRGRRGSRPRGCGEDPRRGHTGKSRRDHIKASRLRIHAHDVAT